MKVISKLITDHISNDDLQKRILDQVSQKGQTVYQDFTLSEAYESYASSLAMLSEEIESGRFESIPHVRRNAIANHLKTIEQHWNNPTHLARYMDALVDQIYSAGIPYRRIGGGDIVNELKSLSKLKRSITDFKKRYDSIKRNLDFISSKRKEFESHLIDMKTLLSDVRTDEEISDKHVSDIEVLLNKARTLESELIEIRKDVEEKKLSVETFAENIDDYKSNLSSLENKAQSIVDKEKDIQDTINKAQEALKFGSAAGISAAFITQYDVANNKNVYRGWIIGASICILLAAGFTAWAIGGWGIKHPDSLNSILGRIFGVAVTIGGAAFCAQQYVRQKNIAEDYAYKATLSKSIVAFTDEISGKSENGDESHVRVYLTKVLDEIHRDPLRSRKDSDQKLSDKSLASLRELLEIIYKQKP